MNAAPEHTQHQPYVGYFASIVLAIICADWMATYLVTQAGELLQRQTSAAWQVNIAAGLFLGIVLANPIGTVVSHGSVFFAALRFATGFGIGMAIQISIFTPMAGEGMSNFLFLLMAGLAQPITKLLVQLWSYLNSFDMHPLIRLLNASDRLFFVTLMGVSFAGFSVYVSQPTQILTILGLVLALLVGHVALQESKVDPLDEPEKADHLAWLALVPEDVVVDTGADAVARVKTIAFTLLPGAMLFGGMTRLAVDFLMLVYPDLNVDVSRPMETIQNLGLVAASGLAVILFGMMAVLGFGIFALRLIGHYKHWSHWRLRDTYLRMIRLLYFRPIGQYWS